MSRRARTPALRVWILTFAVTVLSTVLIVDQRSVPSLTPNSVVPAWAFIVLFFITETTVLNFRFKRHIHSFSMSEVPLIIGIVVLSPFQVHVSHIIGSAIALAIVRKQSPMKLAFNVSQIALQAAVATYLFHLVVGSGDPLGVAGWLGAAAVAIATYSISTVLISLAIRISGGRTEESERSAMLALSSVAGLMNVALGLAVATILVARPASAWLAIVPPMVLYFAYRAYISQRRERDLLQGLYTASQELHRLPNIDDAFAASLAHAIETFDVESAEIRFYPKGPESTGTVSVRTSDGESTTLSAAPIAFGSALARVVAAGRPVIIDESRGSSHTRREHVAMIAPIPSSDGSFGAFIVQQPLTDIGSFRPADLKLLETLAGHLAVSIRNERLGDSVAHLTRVRDDLRHQASHDPLTGLANRSKLFREIEGAIATARGKGSALLYIDLDGFKLVNDTYGHSVGDQMLIHVASVLVSCSRSQDVVARLGGDEFVLLLNDLEHPGTAEVAARRLVGELARPFEAAGIELTPRASVGVAMCDEAESPEELINAADRAMYEAKRDAPGSYRIHAEVSTELPFHDRSFAFELARAIEKSELTLEYQPIIELATGIVTSIEALVRWNHPRRGRISPDEFIPLAERLRLIGDIGTWVLKRALTELPAVFEGAGMTVPLVSINVSAAELNAPNFAAALLQSVRDVGSDPKSIQIEVTESGVVAGGRAALQGLRDAGVRVALDDFGTGYSSLAYLDELPVDVLKIDQAFVRRLGKPKTDALVEMMIGIGGTMNFEVVAEGVETDEQWTALLGLGCGSGQGFGIARPVPASELTVVVRDLAAGRTQLIAL